MKKEVVFSGVSRVPGGAASGDGELAIAVNVANDGMGVQLLEKPELLFELSQGEELLCVHEPEGEGKHYITQIVIESDPSEEPAPDPEEEDTEEPAEDSEEESEEEPAEEEEDEDPGSVVEEEEMPGPAIAEQPASQTSSDPITSGETFTANDSYAPTSQDVIIDESDIDNGGDSTLPTSGESTVTTPTTAGIYLLWRDEEGNIRQQIDISAYGKVTAIQPMGNTLACNHENDGVRYYLWKAADGEYKALGSAPPFIDITFGLESTFKYYPKTPSTFPVGQTSGAYKKYGGVSIDSIAYTDTIPLFWNDHLADAWVPPYGAAVSVTNGHDITTNLGDEDKKVYQNDLSIHHFQASYSIEGAESPDGKTDVSGIKFNWTTMALGAYNKFIAEQTKDNKFVFPFYIRYAVELYDGSQIMHSYPVLMIPNSRGPIFALDGKYGLKADLDDGGQSYEKVHMLFNGRVYGFVSELHRRIKKLTADAYARLENWRDLIRGINIYVTPPIYNYKQGGQVLGWQSMSSLDPENNNKDPWLHYYTVGRVKDANGNVLTETATPFASQEKQSTCMMNCFINNTIVPQNTIYQPYNSTYTGANLAPGYILSIPQKDEIEIEELHDNAGQFYKLASIDFDELLTIVNPTTGDESEKPVKFRNKILTTIANQDVMQDDNFSHDKKSAGVLYGYNRRLNMARVTRTMHSPLLPYTMFPAYPAFTTNSSYSVFPVDWAVVVVAKNGGVMSRLVRHSTSNDLYATLYPNYLFYPNTDAEEIWLKRSGSYFQSATYFRIKLKEHKALNGKFWRGDFYNKNQSLEECAITNQDERYNEIVAALSATSNTNDVVDDNNKIYTTETDNPFYVPFGNINIAGGGEVRALCAATQAMSQGQFGQHPMYTFTSEGVWAMTVDTNGGWGTIQPVTRDAIGEDSMPLSLDSTVVFLTERGLLQLAGAEVIILSDALGTTDTALDLSKFDLITTQIDSILGLTQTIPSQTPGGEPTIITQYPNYTQMRTKAMEFVSKHFPQGDACLAYDSDNGRIYVTPNGENFSWVYNIKSKLWTQATTHIDKQIVTYPECITQQGNNVVLVSVDGGSPSNRYTNGLVVTRPIKMSDMGALKKWREMIVRGQFKNYNVDTSLANSSPMVLSALWGTRNWGDYALVGSSQGSRITRWGGSPYFGHVVMVALHGSSKYNIQVYGIDAEIDAEQGNKLR